MKKYNKNAEHLIIQIQTIRECKDISQSELAKMSGTKQEVISRMETGKNIPSLDSFCNMVNCLGYEVTLKKKENKS